MDQTTLLYVTGGAVVVAAAAMVVQAILLVAIYRLSRGIKEQLAALAAKTEPAVESARKLLEESRRNFTDLSDKTREVLDLSRRQLNRVDDALSEATTRARVQMDRLEMVLDDLAGRFQETTALVHSGIIRPIRQINGLAAGIRAAVAALAGAKITVVQATQDEEMFI